MISTTNPATVIAIRHKVDINSLEKVEAAELRMNEIGAVIVETHKPLYFDPYQQNRATGAFILIDPITNETLGAGMITGPEIRQSQRKENLLANGVRNLVLREQFTDRAVLTFGG